MKWFDRVTKKLAKNASTAVKTEVKKSALDIIPKIALIGAAIASIWLFKDTVEDNRPSLTATHITTNNYFLGDAGEEVIKKILEKED